MSVIELEGDDGGETSVTTFTPWWYTKILDQTETGTSNHACTE